MECLQTLAVPPAVGRWLSPADQNPQGAKTVMLGYGYWQRRFGGERTAIGRAINVDGETRTIVGVMPRGFRMVDQEFDILVPLALDPTNQKLGGFGYYGIGRLKPGVTLQQANADIAPLVNVWMDSWSNGPHTYPHYYDIWHITPNFRPLKQLVVGDVGSVLWLVIGTVGLVMLVACTNVANLLLVRAESRHQELAIRAALGAGRARIARELLVESLVLGLIGGAVSHRRRLRRPAASRRHWPGGAAPPQRSRSRRPLARLHAPALGILRPALRLNSGLQIRALRRFAQAGRFQPHGQRRPRLPPFARHARCCASGHGAGAHGLLAAHDPHLRRVAQCRAGIRRPQPH